MNETIVLSRNKLATFLACQRRFQLRYLERQAWPEAPLAELDEERLGRGQQFHQLLQRHFLGLKVETAAIEDRTLRGWWLAFEKHKPKLPNGRLLPELSLTIPISQHLLHGRFDLLVIGEENGLPFAHIFDWKTGRPPDEATLRHDWQTRLYLAMLAEGGQALWTNSPPFHPDHIAITYWYATAPDEPITIAYNRPWHERNWAELTAVVSQIEAQLAQGGLWPLTDDWSLCRMCAYQALCGRQGAGTAVITLTDDVESDDLFEFVLEPQLP
jgi:CRISPR/Cas system-associated exonuclease Cas4 (RecB family)